VNFQREETSWTVRRIRQAILFLILVVVAVWGFANWRADNHIFAWDKTVSVLVVIVVDPEADPEEDILRGFLSRFLSTSIAREINLAGVERWFESESSRYMKDPMKPLSLTARGPIKATAPPPLPPGEDASFLERWRGTKDFLGYFDSMSERERLVLEGYDAAIFVYFYDAAEIHKYAKQHSLASRRSRIGVVFSAVGPTHFARCATLVAHELCHTLGASDKYEGNRSLFPHGFADPERTPLYPQRHAEIMALGVPVSPKEEKRVNGLSECVVGKKTAAEIGWVE